MKWIFGAAVFIVALVGAYMLIAPPSQAPQSGETATYSNMVSVTSLTPEDAIREDFTSLVSIIRPF